MRLFFRDFLERNIKLYYEDRKKLNQNNSNIVSLLNFLLKFSESAMRSSTGSATRADNGGNTSFNRGSPERDYPEDSTKNG